MAITFCACSIIRNVDARSHCECSSGWHHVQVKELGAEVGVRFLTLGFDPTSATEHVPVMPKNRYDIMRAYMPTRGTLGWDMMLRSCTIQV